jgi:Ferric reductase like transmembrane component/Ferric reductase NAD binding domain/FAD-binding domain
MPSQILNITLINATATESLPSNPTIEPYTTGLNGVDQSSNGVSRDILWWSMGILAMIVLLFRLLELLQSHLRHLFGLRATGKQQLYFSKNQSIWWPKVKKHILLAPLWKKRHNREIRLSSAVNIGTLPSRFHTILLGLYLLSNVIYCLTLDYSSQNRYVILAELRGRSGTLSVANIIPLVILAGRNNPLISWLKISFDTYNLLHRWIGRMAVLEALVHTLAWTISEVANAGWAGVSYKIGNDPFIGYSTVGVIAMSLILITSPSAIRHAFYETFLNVHIVCAAVAMAGIWIHCDIGQLPQLPYIKWAVVLWIGDRSARMARILFYNYSRKAGWTMATVECLPGDACRVTLHLPKHTSIKPGSHAYLRFAAINPWESHPFSIAWTKDKALSMELPFAEKPSLERAKLTTDVSFVIHAQAGWTRQLHTRALSNASPGLSTPALFEGPYQGNHSLDSYGTLLLFAGSSGISHQIPFLLHLISSHAIGTVATRRITLVWIVRDVEHLEWVRPWMDEILVLPSRKEVLTIKLFVTRPNNPQEIVSPSSAVQMYPGRPNVQVLMEAAIKERVGAMCVTVCGPGSLADNVRGAVRDVQEVGVVDFIEESFTW